MAKYLLSGLIAFIVLLGAYFLGPRPTYDANVIVKSIPNDIQRYIDENESGVANLRPELKKEIVWASPQRLKTKYSIVYLHGYTASKAEIHPVCERLAKGLQANLFYTRLVGHGRDADAMAESSVEGYLNDATEALLIGQKLGAHTLVVGTSTGATLAVWLAYTFPKRVGSLMLVSPNLGPKNPLTVLLTGPWAEELVQLTQGPYREYSLQNPDFNRYITGRYATKSLIPMMQLVELVSSLNLSKITTPTRIYYSKHDKVVNASHTEAMFRKLRSSDKRLIELAGSLDPNFHIITGQISPDTTVQVVSETLTFVRSLQRYNDSMGKR